MDTPSTLGDTVIPPYKTKLPNGSHRTLVLCFDGTGDQFDLDNSNVVKFFNLLARGNHKDQMVYYQPGIGTYTSPHFVTSVGRAVSMVLDKMVAWNLDAHVISGYEFLMQHYKKNDKICLFGFSRGGYTARALAGMLHLVGLLPPGNHQHVPFAYKMYKRADRQSEDFKKHFSVNVEITFVGVWDTVSSVGRAVHRRLPFTGSNTAIRVFRHALSLDERRTQFRANHYRFNINIEREVQDRPKTDFKEVWFAGCHCDVGGGSVENHEPNSLARIPLRWMIYEVYRHNTGIQFHEDRFRDFGLDCSLLHRPERIFRFPGSEKEPEFASEADRRDAMHEIYDQLKLKPLWWILEVIPSKRREDDKWWKYTWLNLGHGRTIPDDRVLYVHYTVKMREDGMRKAGRTYKPKANWGRRTPRYTN